MAETQDTQQKTSEKGRVAKRKVRNGLTPKQRVYVKEVASGKSGTEAAMIAYNTDDPKTAAVISSENLNKPNIAEAMEKAFENNNISPDSIAKVFKEAMGATKSVAFKGTVFSSAEPDHAVRTSAAKAAAAIMGAGKADDPGPSGGITFNIGTQNYIKSLEVKP